LPNNSILSPELCHLREEDLLALDNRSVISPATEKPANHFVDGRSCGEGSGLISFGQATSQVYLKR
jgi:hypothetical protein